MVSVQAWRGSWHVPALVLAATLLAGCGSGARSHASARSTQAGLARTVRVAGYALNVKCAGSPRGARPTIVLLAGATEPLTTFTYIQSQLSRSTRVCSYDRPGDGGSSAPRGRQTPAGSAAVLHELLATLNVYRHGVVLVGHSLGGLLAATYASRYRTSHQVKALVLLDATPYSLGAKVLRLIPPEARGPAGEFRSFVASFQSGQDQELLLLGSHPPAAIGDVPVIVVRHGRPIFTGITGYARQLEGIWLQGQRAWLRLSPRSRMVVAANSGHAIYLDQPGLTLRLIRQALSEAR